MIKEISTYNNTLRNSFFLRNLIAYIFLLFVLIKPVVTFATIFEEVKHELSNSFDKNNTEEKKEMNELDDELFYDSYRTHKTAVLKQSLLYAILNNDNLTRCLKIQLPPPKLFL